MFGEAGKLRFGNIHYTVARAQLELHDVEKAIQATPTNRYLHSG